MFHHSFSQVCLLPASRARSIQTAPSQLICWTSFFKLILPSTPSSSKWRRSYSFQTKQRMCCYVTTGHIVRCKYWRYVTVLSNWRRGTGDWGLRTGDWGLCSRYKNVAYELSSKTNRMKRNKTWERQALRSKCHCSSFTIIIKKTDNNIYSKWLSAIQHVTEFLHKKCSWFQHLRLTGMQSGTIPHYEPKR